MKQPLTAKRIAAESTRHVLCRSLLLDPKVDDAALFAEVVRAVAFASTQEVPFVSTALLTDRVMEVLRCSTSRKLSAVRTNVTEMIDLLGDFGDLVRHPDGTWTPAFSVSIARKYGGFRIISGVPLRSLPGIGTEEIHVLEGQRFSTDQIRGVPLSTPDKWIGDIEEDLPSWTHSTVNSDGVRPPSEKLFSNDTVRFRFYRPDLHSSETPQTHRWTPEDSSMTGRYLMQIDQFPPSPTYSVCQLKDGTLQGYRTIHMDTARRLMFGLDAAHDRSVKVAVTPNSDSVTLSVSDRLPFHEFRRLSSLSSVGSQYRWRVRRSDEAEALEVLQSIGVAPE